MQFNGKKKLVLTKNFSLYNHNLATLSHLSQTKNLKIIKIKFISKLKIKNIKRLEIYH
jgi:hypothetical protein